MQHLKLNDAKMRTLQSGAWYWINKSVLQAYGPTLHPAGIAVYNVLALYANGHTQECFPTQGEISRLIGVSRRTVIRKIKHLASLGLIQVKRRNRVIVYRLLESIAQ